jgi:predicted metal-dependent hydrolase
MSWQAAENFLQENLAWLKQKSLAFPKPLSLVKHFEAGGKLCLSEKIGERKVRIIGKVGTDRPCISLENNEVSIHVVDSIEQEAMLKDACRKLANQFLPEWVDWAEQITGLSPKKIRIGDQKTRWGSCSHLGTISLNWRMILLPKDLGSYVVFHELIHLEEMNHSSKFWAKLDEFVPNSKDVDRKLTQNGRSIFALGRVT